VCRGVPVLLRSPLSGAQRFQIERWEGRDEGAEIDWGDSFDPSVPNLLSLRNRKVLDRLPLARAEPVIEVGCSTGKNLRYLAWRTGASGYGVDIALPPLVNALGKSRAQQKFFVADAECLPFEDESFAALVAFDVLEHVQVAEHALGEWTRVVRKGGVVAVSVPVVEVFPTFAWWRSRFFPRHAASAHEALGHDVTRFPRPQKLLTWLTDVGLRPFFVEFRAALLEPIWDFVLLPSVVAFYQWLSSLDQNHRISDGIGDTSESSWLGNRRGRRRLLELLAVRPGRAFTFPDRLLETMGRGSQLYVLARRV
jgi:ubiquinone/menaquinone biosynthesis C-methylase UbiE